MPQAPEVQTMYSLNLPVSTLRTKIRQEFERHRYVNQLRTVDVLLFSSHQEYQVRHGGRTPSTVARGWREPDLTTSRKP
jgi:hypothetical protein